MRNGDAETGQRQPLRQGEEIAQVRRRNQERQVYRVHAAGLEGAVVHGRRNRMPDGVRNHAVDLRRLPQALHVEQAPQLMRAHLPGRGTLRVHGRGVSENPAKHRREHPRGKAQLAHRQHHQPMLGQRLGGGQHAHIVGGLARRSHHLVGVGLHPHHPAHHGIHGRGGLEVVVGNDHARPPAELVEALGRGLRRLDFDIHRLRARRRGLVQHAQLLFDAAVELAVVLMPPAGGDHDGFRKLLQKLPDGAGTVAGAVQEVQTEFEETLSRGGLPPGMVQQGRNVRKAQCDANPRERPGLRHLGFGTSQNTTGAAARIRRPDRDSCAADS